MKQRRQRFLERLERREKTWKFSFGDLEERKHWSDYRQPFEQMVQNTITKRDRGGSSPPTTSG
jgi:polyphosphate kinase 2 (PPK2 family)